MSPVKILLSHTLRDCDKWLMFCLFSMYTMYRQLILMIKCSALEVTDTCIGDWYLVLHTRLLGWTVCVVLNLVSQLKSLNGDFYDRKCLIQSLDEIHRLSGEKAHSPLRVCHVTELCSHSFIEAVVSLHRLLNKQPYHLWLAYMSTLQW